MAATAGDLLLAHRLLCSSGDLPGQFLQFLFRCQQQLFPPTAPLLGQQRIVAGHQPLAGEVGRVDLGQIDFVEQRPIERALIHQLPNPPAPEGGNPAQFGMRLEPVDLRLGKHSAVAGQDHPQQTESHSQLLDLIGHRGGITRIARINLHGQRPAAAIHGDYQFSISAPLALMPGDPPSTPEVLVRRVDRLRRFVALPKQVGGQPVQWKRRGLKQAQLPEGFAAPPDAEAFVIYEAGKGGRATLSRSHARENPRVRLADVQVAWQADGSCVGVARFDLEPGRSSECELWLPTGYSLLRVSLSGVPTEPVPAEPPSSHVRAWRLSLGRAGLVWAGLPQQIEVLFNGKSTDPARAAGRTFQAPTLGRLAVEQTLWTVVGPSPLEPGRPEDRSLVAPWSHELSRLKSAAGLIESASTVPGEDAEETLRWYRRWAGRLVAARTALEHSSAPNGPTGKALEEIAAIDARQLQIARRLGVGVVYRRLKQEGVPPSEAPAELWRRSLQPGQASTRCVILGRSGSITLSYRRARTTGLPYRLAGATGLVVLIVLVVLGLRRGTLAEWFQRWPQAIGVAAGLAWWLWLSPSILGWGIVLVSLVASLLSGWKYSPPAPGSSVISLRARQG